MQVRSLFYAALLHPLADGALVYEQARAAAKPAHAQLELGHGLASVGYPLAAFLLGTFISSVFA